MGKEINCKTELRKGVISKEVFDREVLICLGVGGFFWKIIFEKFKKNAKINTY